MKTKYQTEDPTWVSFYPKFNSGFYVEKAGYFDERPQVHTGLTQLIALALLFVLPFFTLWALLLIPFVLFGWGKLFINLPIHTGIQDGESAAWGFGYHHNKIWIYIGGGGNNEGGRKWKTFTMPWDLTWVRTSILLNDDTWEHEYPLNHKNFYEDSWKEKQKSWQYDYTDRYDGTTIPTTIYVEEREWRPLWFMWTSLFAKKRRSIDIHFSKEVGKEKGSWKGGVLGTGYELLPNEEPLECLKRMEKERIF